MGPLQEALKVVWDYLREACGENDYARYRAHVLARGGTPMKPEAFYLWHLQHKYSRPSRCC